MTTMPRREVALLSGLALVGAIGASLLASPDAEATSYGATLFRFRMVRAYPTISEIADVHEATHDEIDEGFARCLNNRHLRVVAESYLEDRRA